MTSPAVSFCYATDEKRVIMVWVFQSERDEVFMLYQEQLARKIQTLPPSLLPMVDVFVDFLLTRYSFKHPIESDLDVTELTKLARLGGAFDWLDEAGEDGIYTDEDGEPV